MNKYIAKGVPTTVMAFRLILLYHGRSIFNIIIDCMILVVFNMLSYYHFPLLLPVLMDGLDKKHERDAYYYRY